MAEERIEDGGPAFPTEAPHPGGGMATYLGLTIRDYFAAHAPAPNNDDVHTEYTRDKNRNPYNEGHKPRLRERIEIIADLNYAYADAMLAARSKKGGA